MSVKNKRKDGSCDDIDNFLTIEKGHGLTHTSLEMYRTQLESLCHYLKEQEATTLRTATSHHIERYLAHRKQQGMKRTTVNQRIHTFTRFFTYMCNAGLRDENPMDGVPVARLTDESSFPPIDEKPSSLKRGEVATLLSKMKIPRFS